VLGSNGSTLQVDAGYVVNDGNGGANYSVATNTAAGTISQATLTLDAVTDSKVYDATTASAGVVQVSGLQGSDDVTGEAQSFASSNVLGANGSTLQVDAGYVVVDGNSGGNYAVVANTASGTITPAALTITADDASRQVGAPDPAFSVSYSGFVAGENESVLTGTAAVTSAATQASQMGSYALTPSGLASSNYAITFVDGELTISGLSAGQLAAIATATGMAGTLPAGSSAGAALDFVVDASGSGSGKEKEKKNGKSGQGHGHGSLMRVDGSGMRLPDGA
jgi:hypothetical protein